MHIIHHSPQIWTIEHFLTPEECTALIALSEDIGYNEAEVGLSSGPKMMKNIRNNSRIMYNDTDLANSFWERLQPHCPGEIEDNYVTGLNEQFRFYKYESAQRFKRHIDGRFRRNESEESRITFMIYLNDDFEGGETTFDEISIKPSTGDALCFIHELKHEGCPVTSGIKYALRTDVMYKKKGS
ncbi:MAG TPA: 2OG-Fe(II) oxygenase [Chitinophaga sp.]|uniref:prolyl hydroxylase family protein n=1 Tax=Chitinophaga sp. TaxID=1869181 RepID=UPI002B654F52|nr:2OG-Fe(II) oxygenase [Chitinophaga sp.]HVI47832.1 2OG-Fe(II) oxygenase [Chitinophaga sp.]